MFADVPERPPRPGSPESPLRLELGFPLPFVAAAVGLLSLAACSDQAVNANNTPPTATIDQPTVGTEVLEGSEVEFSGTQLWSDRGSAPARGAQRQP